jgi:hypothetical protein
MAMIHAAGMNHRYRQSNRTRPIAAARAARVAYSTYTTKRCSAIEWRWLTGRPERPEKFPSDVDEPSLVLGAKPINHPTNLCVCSVVSGTGAATLQRLLFNPSKELP